MITRTVEKTLIFSIYLNSVTARIQELNRVAISTDYEALVSWYNEQMTDKPAHDNEDKVRNMIGGAIFKHFKKGSPLEYYNPYHSSEIMESASRIPMYGGVVEQWFRSDVTQQLLDGAITGCTIVCKD